LEIFEGGEKRGEGILLIKFVLFNFSKKERGWKGRGGWEMEHFLFVLKLELVSKSNISH